MNAMVLAGGINRILLYQGYTPGYKALLLFHGKPAIQYTLDALRSTRAVRRICIVGPVQEIKETITNAGNYELVNSGETLIENIHRGLEHFRNSPFVLVIPADLPLATPQSIGNFLSMCAEVKTTYETNILWSMVREENFTGAFIKEKKKGFNRFKDVSVCHGNLLLISPSLLGNSRFSSRLDSIYNARKSSIRAALAVGPLLGLSYLTGVHVFHVLTLSQFAKIASASFGVGLVPVLIDYPEIAVDIDEPRDYQFIKEELDRRGQIEAQSMPAYKMPHGA